MASLQGHFAAAGGRAVTFALSDLAARWNVSMQKRREMIVERDQRKPFSGSLGRTSTIEYFMNFRSELRNDDVLVFDSLTIFL
jgi:hypothetical protein